MSLGQHSNIIDFMLINTESSERNLIIFQILSFHFGLQTQNGQKAELSHAEMKDNEQNPEEHHITLITAHTA